jgi:hypothetical protein
MVCPRNIADLVATMRDDTEALSTRLFIPPFLLVLTVTLLLLGCNDDDDRIDDRGFAFCLAANLEV